MLHLLWAVCTLAAALCATASGVAFQQAAKDGPVGYGKTAGGEGGRTIRVSSASQLEKEVQGNEKKVIIVQGKLALGKRLKVGSNKSIIGAGGGAVITSKGITISSATNVIIRNLKISKILKEDGITVHSSKYIWIDHNEFESDCCEGGPDKYDGLIDIVRGSDFITLSWNYFHDHWKANLIGNSDKNRAQDTGKLHVTLHHNHWKHMGTRGPAGRFGFQHVYNNLYTDYLYQAIHSRSDNQMLVEGNVFRGKCGEALSTHGLVIPKDSPNTSPDGDPELDGFVNLGSANDFGPCSVNITRNGTFTSVPYEYALTPLAQVASVVEAGAGIGKIKADLG